MLNSHDIAAALLTATLRTGLSAEAHGVELAALLAQPVDAAAVADAVDMVKRRVTAEIRGWLSDVLFASACRVDGELGRALGGLSATVLID